MPRDSKPVHEVRIRMIKATIWKNGTEEKPFYNTNIGRIYNAEKDKDAKADWQTTDSFGLDDLPLVEKCAARAFGWICQQEDKARAARRAEKETE